MALGAERVVATAVAVGCEQHVAAGAGVATSCLPSLSTCRDRAQLATLSPHLQPLALCLRMAHVSGDDAQRARSSASQPFPLPEIRAVDAASVTPEAFLAQYRNRIPVVLRGAAKHWTAVSKWSDREYMTQLLGGPDAPCTVGEVRRAQYILGELSQFTRTLHTGGREHDARVQIEVHGEDVREDDHSRGPPRDRFPAPQAGAGPKTAAATSAGVLQVAPHAPDSGRYPASCVSAIHTAHSQTCTRTHAYTCIHLRSLALTRTRTHAALSDPPTGCYGRSEHEMRRQAGWGPGQVLGAWAGRAYTCKHVRTHARQQTRTHARTQTRISTNACTYTNARTHTAQVGGAGIVTPLHYDNCHSVIVQTVGRKRVLTIPLEHGRFVYPKSAATGQSSEPCIP